MRTGKRLRIEISGISRFSTAIYRQSSAVADFGLLFPIALFGAIYTAEFLNPKNKVFIKPAMEIMASLPSLSTRLVAFSSTVTDLTDQLTDPVDLLFGIQLRGGTNIERALTYCHSQVSRPLDTVMVLLTDLYEGGNRDRLIRRAAAIKADGVELIVLLALDDRGAPRFNRTIAQQLADLEIPVFACTPDHFPDLMGAAVNGLDIREWAATEGIAVAPRA